MARGFLSRFRRVRFKVELDDEVRTFSVGEFLIRVLVEILIAILVLILIG